jgi:hypothetical protein
MKCVLTRLLVDGCVNHGAESGEAGLADNLGALLLHHVRRREGSAGRWRGGPRQPKVALVVAQLGGRFGVPAGGRRPPPAVTADG